MAPPFLYSLAVKVWQGRTSGENLTLDIRFPGAFRPKGAVPTALLDQVDDQLEFGWLLHRQVGRLGALANSSGVNADLAIGSREACSIADQAAGRDELAPRIDRRNSMARCERHELLAPAAEERIRADDERASMQLDEGGESDVDLAFGAGLQDRKLHPLRARRFLHVSYYALYALGIRIVRVDEQGDHLGLGNQLGKQLEPLGRQLAGEDADAREVAARPGETGDQAVRDRVAGPEDDRDRRGGVFRRECRRGGGRGDDQIYLAADEISGQCGQPIIVALRP